MRTLYTSDAAVIFEGDCRDLPKVSHDLLLTDPPYGVEWQSGYRDVAFKAIEGDDATLDVPAILGELAQGLRHRRHLYVFGYTAEDLKSPLRLSATADLVWDKAMQGLGNLSLPWAPSHERITFGIRLASSAKDDQNRGRLAARLRQGSVLKVPRPNGSAVTKHPTEKPVALMRMLVEASSLAGDWVFDPFVGSGSTLVAAILSGRRAVGCEIDPTYAALAVERVRAAEAVAALAAAA